MSSWYTNEDGVLKEERDYSFRPGKECMNCGETRIEVSENGGWCDPCCGVKTIVSEEEQQRRYDAAHAAIMARAEKSPRYQKQKADAERLWQEHLKNKAQYEAIFGKNEVFGKKPELSQREPDDDLGEV